MNLCLNMIVRNESAQIERALLSALPYIRSWVICDTGSTDDTKEKILRFFSAAGIPGELRDIEFKNFGQARNEALAWARKLTFAYQPTHFLLLDADMELRVKDPKAFEEFGEGGICYEMMQTAGAVTYANKRILSSIGKWEYKGVTHEYLDAPTTGLIPAEVADFYDHADGANRPDKFKRDIRLLKQGLKDEPNNERYMYYLASSYRDAGKFAEAAKWFQRRVRAGGWDEEVWSAQQGFAHALKALGDEAGFVKEMLVAYQMRPQRAESLFDLAHWYRADKQQPIIANVFASIAKDIPRPNDRLFVNDFVYKIGIREELSITDYYTPANRERGRKLNDWLSMEKHQWSNISHQARNNQYHYLRPLAEVAPSFRTRQIPFVPPDGLVPMNPSVVWHHGQFLVNVRAVNYVIDEAGRYIIRGTDGTANGENPIDTRNFILNFGADPESQTMPSARECYRPGNMPVEFSLVTGFEDVRLISFADALWGSATVRQLHTDGNCEQVLTRIEDCTDGYVHGKLNRMLRQPRETEKNWSPILDPYPTKPLQFMWRPGVVINAMNLPSDDGRPFAVQHEAPIWTDNFAGSSQVIPWWEDGDVKQRWLAIVHTSATIPGSHKRFYHHRFVEYDDEFKLTRVSLPFCFHEKEIEFCAGMTWWPAMARLVLSYGRKDSEAWLGFLSAADVSTLLNQGHQL